MRYAVIVAAGLALIALGVWLLFGTGDRAYCLDDPAVAGDQCPTQAPKPPDWADEIVVLGVLGTGTVMILGGATGALGRLPSRRD